jgi:two-component system nitrate/nitrite response regulator NarP
LLEALSLEVNGIILKDGAQNLLLHCLEQVASGSKWIEPRLLQQVGVRDAPGEEANDRLRLLSPRERAMAFMAGQGFRNRQIATELGIAEGTVKVSLHRVYEKLGVSSRVELSLLISSVP